MPLSCLPLEDTVLRNVQGLGTVKLRWEVYATISTSPSLQGCGSLVFHRDITSVDMGVELSVKPSFPINIALLYCVFL